MLDTSQLWPTNGTMVESLHHCTVPVCLMRWPAKQVTDILMAVASIRDDFLAIDAHLWAALDIPCWVDLRALLHCSSSQDGHNAACRRRDRRRVSWGVNFPLCLPPVLGRLNKSCFIAEPQAQRQPSCGCEKQAAQLTLLKPRALIVLKGKRYKESGSKPGQDRRGPRTAPVQS